MQLLNDLCQNSRYNVMGKPNKIDTKRATLLLNCVRREEASVPELNTLKKLLREAEITA